MRILVLEDHDDTRDLLSLLLRRDGHDVVASPSSEDAARHTIQNVPELAVLDVGLPGKSGADFGRELKQRSPQTKIVFVTGDPDLERLQEVVPDSLVLSKPMNVALFRQTIERLSHAPEA